VARLAVPAFADWAAVDVVSEGGVLRRLATAHADPAKVALSAELERRYPPDPSAQQGAYHVLRTGRPDMMREIPEALLQASARDAEHLRLVKGLGLRSYLCVPLAVRGKTLGVLTFVTAESGRLYGPAELAVAEDLAHRAAVAVENAQLYRELRETDRRKDEFLAMLAHELRNSLAPVRNGLQILRLGKADVCTVEQTREMMERQVQHIVRLVDDLLDVSRTLRGKITLRKEVVELSAVVARAVETAQPSLDAAGHQLSLSLPPEPAHVYGDVVRLTQVVSNLLVNACKYSERAGRVWVTGSRAGGEVVLRVKDAGVGIAKEDIDRIFDLFAQVDRSVERSQGGLGVGLTLVKKLVEMHGGTVTAHSDGPGKGSEFEIRLPAAQPARAAAAEAVAPGPAAARRVLIVDDNVDAAESLALVLRLLGHEVRTAYDGRAGLAAARQFRPEVMLLDIGLPGLSGYEVARELRREPEFGRTLLAAMTGYGQEEDRRRSRESGFDHHLVKPVDPAALEGLLAGARAGA
jgi:signal transduction histidine kinase